MLPRVRVRVTSRVNVKCGNPWGEARAWGAVVCCAEVTQVWGAGGLDG